MPRNCAVRKHNDREFIELAMDRPGLRAFLSCFAFRLLEEFREELPRPLRLGLVGLIMFVALAVLISPLPGAGVVRGDIGLTTPHYSSDTVRENLRAARAHHAWIERRTSPGGS